ncbi:TIR domain-containing protein [Psychrobacter sp. NPDC078631]|uniref:TIR domain-containing protein n=1 Tax=Psychrobacter sp. NPDC078631 TaxID=3390666 RepID=UPI003D08BF6F
MTTSNFDLAIMSGDKIVISKNKEFPATRDNTIFELELFMGFLGKQCTLIAILTG